MATPIEAIMPLAHYAALPNPVLEPRFALAYLASILASVWAKILSRSYLRDITYFFRFRFLRKV